MWVQNKGTTNSEAEGKTEQKVDQRGGGVNQGVPRRRVPEFCSYSKGFGSWSKQEVFEGF